MALILQHSALNPASPSAQYSQRTALEWFETQWKLTGGKGAPKNINTMAPFYCLAELIAQKRTDDPRWLAWCDEWAEWIIHDLPKTEEGGFQHSEFCFLSRTSCVGESKALGDVFEGASRPYEDGKRSPASSRHVSLTTDFG
jgi:unsaturated rhamnogalacturonyl hydrolase